MGVEIFFDCGAPSIYNLLSKKNKNKVMGSHIKQRRFDNFDYVETKQYKKYRREYADFVRENEHVLSLYPNLDVINNAELTYRNQMWMERHGLHPAPVWHFGSDVKWLHRYIKEGYKYLCMGGMVPNHTRVLRPALDRLWLKELVDKDGMPKLKIHGFALTSFELMYRYPWYSVDSKSWIDYARFGRLLIPMRKNGKLDFCHPKKVAVSHRSFDTTTAKRQVHFKALPKTLQQYILGYLNDLGIAYGESSFKKVKPGYKPVTKKELWAVPGKVVEVIEAPGVCNTNYCRMDVNLHLYREIEKAVPEWPWSLFKTVRAERVRGLF